MSVKQLILKLANTEQAEFIECDSNKDILVSASAGTGKTSSMISKILYLIVQKNISVENMLILTFTNAAANEMKIKLFKALQELLTATTDIALKERISQQLELINNADIGTNHGFCKKLITKYFYVIGVDPAFSLAPDKEQKFLLNEAITNVFNNYVINDDKRFFEVYECYNTKREATPLKSIVENVYSYLKSVVDERLWKTHVLNTTYNLQLNDNSCVIYLMQTVKDQFAKMLSEFNALKQRTESITVSSAKLLEFIDNVLGAINLVLNSTTYDELRRALHEYKYMSRRPSAIKTSSIEEREIFNDLAEVWEIYKKDVRDNFKSYIINASEKQLIKQTQAIKNNLIKIFEIVDKVDAEYKALKRNRQLLDFNDLEQYTIQLLKNDQALTEIKNQYDYIFFDEYQDVNSIQELILKQLKRPNNLIMIGDVKQCIYKFRKAKPENFIEKYNNKTSNQIFNFYKNYRSEDNILQFVNSVFQHLITENTIGVDYKDAMLKSGKTTTGNSVVSMDIIDSTAGGDKVLVDEAAEGEARLIAKKISEYIDMPHKEYKFKDIAVLKRNKSRVDVLYKVLKECDIPVALEYKSNLFESYEICLLISILKLINNFQDDLAVATVLKSFIINLDENALAEIRLSDATSAFWQAVLNYNKDDEIGNGINRLKKHIQFYKNYMLDNNIYQTLEKILFDFDMINHFNSLPGGSEMLSNISEFLTLSINDNYAFCLTKFLDYIDNLSSSPHDLSADDGDDCVQIITMHSSKGLDYPCVIATGLGSGFVFNTNHDFMENDTFGIGLKHIDNVTRLKSNSLVERACKLNNIKSIIDEEIRLFYVALTRAKDYLHLIGSYPLNSKFKNAKNIYSCKSFLDLFFYSCNDVDLHNFTNNKQFILNENTDSQCEVVIYNIDETQFEIAEQSDVVLSGGDDEVVKKLQQLFAYKYPYSIEKEIAIKNSVTSIMQEEEPYQKMSYAPNQFKINDKDNLESNHALMLGNLYHAVMEKLNYNETRQEISAIINTVVKDNVEWQQIINKVNIAEIEKAISVVKKILDGGKLKKECQFILSVPHNELIKDSAVSDKIIVQGVIDCVVDFGSYAIIIDYKTNKFKNEESFKSTYHLQLEIYAKAYEYAYNKTVKNKYIYSFNLGKLIEV